MFGCDNILVGSWLIFICLTIGLGTVAVFSVKETTRNSLKQIEDDRMPVPLVQSSKFGIYCLHMIISPEGV